MFDKAPECNRELASQGDNADLANPRTVFTAGAPIPFGQSAARLIAQPTPGQLDEERAGRFVAGLADALLAAALATGVWLGVSPR